MKNMRHTFITFATAVALIVASVPATAFATSPDGGAERSDPAPEVPIIDVTVPVGFILGGDAGLDIQQLGEVQASAEFVNNSNIGVRIKEATCDAAGLNSYFEVGEGNTAKLSLIGKEISWVPNAEGAQSIYTESSEDLREGIIFGVGDRVSTSMTLSMKDMGLKDAVIQATKDRTALRDLMKLTWTFERAASGSEEDEFFLRINDDATHEALAPYAGQCYSLQGVSSMADDLSKNGEDSIYYDMFKAMVSDVQPHETGDDATVAAGQYTCQVKWNGDGDGNSAPISYDVRVVGINHDDLATPANGRTKAGLTFQFVNLMTRLRQVNSSATNAGGWGQSQLRANMNPDTLPNAGAVVNGSDTNSIWDLVPSDQQEAFKTVKKLYQPTYNNRTDTQEQLPTIDDKLFIASLGEHFAEYADGGPYWSQALSWLLSEGLSLRILGKQAWATVGCGCFTSRGLSKFS
ncbi:hypothetical protein [Adlercreutzia murintestinalis]|uniref:hypothetical protein n=1 Tax=Adlercreutzia murintestinalis TaxID=2941325 RepID=UPI00203DAFB8|nr:hypothetical protein [Adlercreutzia murintestinalis]